MSGYPSFLTRNFVLNGPCLDKPASFLAIMCSWSILWDSLFGGALGLQAFPSQFWPLADCIAETQNWNEQVAALVTQGNACSSCDTWSSPATKRTGGTWGNKRLTVSVCTRFPFSPTGYNCQVNINECASNPCLNQGTCFDDISGYTCHCALPYTGEYCRPAGQSGCLSCTGQR